MQRAVRGPAPARLEDGRGDGGLLEQRFRGLLGEEVEDVGEWEAVLLGERDVDAVVGGGGLQFEVEAAAETLAQREPPGLVDAASKGRMQDELHAAALIEEALGDDGGAGGNGSQDRAAGDDVGNKLARRGGAEAALLHEPGGGGCDLLLRIGGVIPGLRIETCHPSERRPLAGDPAWGTQIGGRHMRGAGCDLLAEFADAAGEDGGTLGRFAEPEGQRGRRAMCIFDEDAARGFDALNAPTGVAEQNHVAGAGFHGEVLVEGGDLYAFRLQYDVEQRGVGDGAAVRDGDGARAATRVELAVDAVAEEIRAVAAAGGFDALAEQRDDLVEERAREIAVRVGAAENGEESVFVPGFRGDTGDDLLHQHVNGLRRDFEPVQLARAHLADQGGLFEQVIAGGGEEAAFGDGSAPVAGAADPLHGNGDGAGAGDLADEVDAADVDS